MAFGRHGVMGVRALKQDVEPRSRSGADLAVSFVGGLSVRRLACPPCLHGDPAVLSALGGVEVRGDVKVGSRAAKSAQGAFRPTRLLCRWPKGQVGGGARWSGR